MTVYADVLLIVNMYVDFLLLCCVQGFLRLAVKGWRLVLGALAGALVAVLASLLGLADLPLFAPAVAGGISTLAAAGAAFAPLRAGLFVRCWLCAWAFSFLLAGFLLFISQFAPAGSMGLLGGAVYLNISLPVLFVSTLIAYGFFWLLRRVLPHDSAAPPQRLTVEHLGHTAELYAKADTGSGLREPFSGLPVIVCEARAIKDAAPPGVLNYPEACGQMEAIRLVPFESLGGKGLLPAFKPDRVSMRPRRGPPAELLCYIAVTKTPLGSFSALYNPDLFPH